MKKTIKLLGAIALLGAIVPLSAYAATSVSTTTDKAAPAPAISTQIAQNDTESADDATTGAVEKPNSETSDAAEKPETVDPNEQAKLEQAAKITQQQAIDAALKQVSGTIKKVELEDENGVIVFNVHIVDANGKGSEVKIDAKTGSIAKSEVDHNDGSNSDGETNDDN